MLYRDAPAEQRVKLDLLERTAIPPTNITMLVARIYREFLRRAAIKKCVPLGQLAEAKVELSFNTDLHIPADGREIIGEAFLCTVTLTLQDGRLASTQRVGRSLRYEKASWRTHPRQRFDT